MTARARSCRILHRDAAVDQWFAHALEQASLHKRRICDNEHASKSVARGQFAELQDGVYAEDQLPGRSKSPGGSHGLIVYENAGRFAFPGSGRESAVRQALPAELHAPFVAVDEGHDHTSARRSLAAVCDQAEPGNKGGGSFLGQQFFDQFAQKLRVVGSANVLDPRGGHFQILERFNDVLPAFLASGPLGEIQLGKLLLQLLKLDLTVIVVVVLDDVSLMLAVFAHDFGPSRRNYDGLNMRRR